MREQYPFFRENDERTQAVIGEKAIASDLSGAFQKPYALLTSKRLYCKNSQGNFIIDARNLLSSGIAAAIPGRGLLWAAFAMSALWALIYGFGIILRWLIHEVIYFIYLDNMKAVWSYDYEFEFAYPEFSGYVAWIFNRVISVRVGIGMVCLILFLIFRNKCPKIAPVLLCIAPILLLIDGLVRSGPIYLVYIKNFFYSEAYWLEPLARISGVFSYISQFGSIILVAIFYIKMIKQSKGNRMFLISHTGGVFTFAAKDYPAGELKNFAGRLKAMKAGGKNG